MANVSRKTRTKNASNATPPPAAATVPSFNREIFRDQLSADRYHLLQTRKVIQEKEVVFNGGANDPILDQFNERHWHELAKMKSSMKEITLEFYAAVDPKRREFRSRVRGCEVQFTPRAIQRVLNTNFDSSTMSCHYQKFISDMRWTTDNRVPMTDGEDCPYRHILRTIAQPGTEWEVLKSQPEVPHRIKGGQLNAEASFWHKFSIFNMLPINHANDVNVPRAALLCAIISGDPIDLCTMLAQDIFATICDRPANTSLGHSGLIQLLCQRARVTIPVVGERLFYRASLKTRDFIQVDEGPDTASDEEFSQPADHGPDTASIMDRLAQLEARSIEDRLTMAHHTELLQQILAEQQWTRQFMESRFPPPTQAADAPGSSSLGPDGSDRD